ncbi:hypothetical protein Tco_1014999, partial [Tanacetum coccineum]
YVVSTGRVIATVSIKVPTGRYIVPAGYIVPTGRTSLKDLSRAETYTTHSTHLGFCLPTLSAAEDDSLPRWANHVLYNDQS